MTYEEQARAMQPETSALLNEMLEIVERRKPPLAAYLTALTQMFLAVCEASGNDVDTMRGAFNTNVDAYIAAQPKGMN